MTQPHVSASPSVRQSITVPVDQQRAFEAFTAQLGRWWPREYHIGQSEMADFVIEPRPGGRWYELGVDGITCDTGRVLAFEPPRRLVLAWHLNERFQFDPDPDHASEVEVRFIAEGASLTRVDLEHRAFERHAAGGDAVRGAVDGPGGWSLCLSRFAGYLAA
jgi:uncharacterized protein YndB with AHSA1/START domain